MFRKNSQKSLSVSTPSQLSADIIDDLIDDSKLTKSEQLGEGSSATVWRGTFQSQPVAIKQPLNPKNPDKESVKKEIRFLTKIMKNMEDDTKIVKYFGRTSSWAIVLELMDTNLENVLEKSPEINWSLKIKIMLDVARGLKFIHNLQILHLDIKPSNILVSHSYDAKITDFDLALFLTEKGTGFNCFRGSPICAPPETLKSLFVTNAFGKTFYNSTEVISYTIPGEVYAFALLLWCIAAWQPYVYSKIDDLTDLINFVCIQKKRDEIPEKTPLKIAALIKQCWTENPADRLSETKIIEILSDADPNKNQNTTDKKKNKISEEIDTHESHEGFQGRCNIL